MSLMASLTSAPCPEGPLQDVQRLEGVLQGTEPRRAAHQGRIARSASSAHKVRHTRSSELDQLGSRNYATWCSQRRVTVTSTEPVIPPAEESTEPRTRRTWLYVVLGLGAVFLLGVRAAWFFTIDDAYITFRYSANLARGHGPVWNVGEDPVEGFTNFLWMAWHTPFAWLGFS